MELRSDRRAGRLLQSALVRAFLLLPSVLVAARSEAANPAQSAPALETLQGAITVEAAGAPVLHSSGKDVRLTADLSYLLHTLEDPRLAKLTVRVEGVFRADGTFEVDHLFTVHNGRLYKLRYYCNICHIAALEPGPCVCCQRPTDLEEIPVDEVTKDTLVLP